MNGESTAHALAAAMDWTLAGVAAPFNASSPPSSGLGKGDDSGPVFIDMLHLGLAVLVMVFNMMASIWLKLALHQKLAVATVRVVLQLSILGYILVPIFTINKAWLSCLYMTFMLVVAAIESVSRPAMSYDGMLWQTLVSLGAPCSALLAYGLGIVIRPSPWYEAQYLIPVAGMLLGNACSGAAIALSTVLDDFSSGRDRIEQLLALGATRFEAAQDTVRRAARMALTPTINQMNVAGIVAIPGMMTGQILGGADPTTAARYQMTLLLFIAASNGIGSIAAIFFAVTTVLDHEHRLREDRLHPRETSDKGFVTWVMFHLTKAWRALARRFSSLRSSSSSSRGEPATRKMQQAADSDRGDGPTDADVENPREPREEEAGSSRGETGSGGENDELRRRLLPRSK